MLIVLRVRGPCSGRQKGSGLWSVGGGGGGHVHGIRVEGMGQRYRVGGEPTLPPDRWNRDREHGRYCLIMLMKNQWRI